MPLFSETTLKEGDPAPDFTLPDQGGEKVTLSSYRGRPVVLYFYPKAGTPVCTAEACTFRDALPDFPKGTAVLGVSKDTVAAQKKFADRNKLNFPVLADEKGEVIKLYGVDLMFGYSQRRTFLIDAAGKIAKVFHKVEPRTHTAELSEALAALPQGPRPKKAQESAPKPSRGKAKAAAPRAKRRG